MTENFAPHVGLAELVDTSHTAVVTQECQNGVIGDVSVFTDLVAEVRRQALPNIVRLVQAARGVGVDVVHCLAVRRADDRGSNANGRLFRWTRKAGIALEPGSYGAQVVDEIGVEPDDLVLHRFHGLSPMSGTELDAVLRNLGVRTVVPLGVSVNVAITNFCMDAANGSYQVVLPRDAVAGIPRDYADAMIDTTLATFTTVTTTDELLAAWGRS